MKFEPGKSGNPGGRPKADVTLRDMARTHDTKVITFLASVIESTSADLPSKLKASDILLDRGHGKPVTMNLEADPREPPIELTDDTTDARQMAHRAIARMIRLNQEDKEKKDD
jgi:hypothetical protein